MNNLVTKAFWLNASERGVATFAQTLGALIGLEGVGAIPAVITWDVDLKAAGVAALLSLLKSVGSVAPIVPSDANAAPATPAQDLAVTARSIGAIDANEARDIALNLVAKSTAPYPVPSELPTIAVTPVA